MSAVAGRPTRGWTRRRYPTTTVPSLAVRLLPGDAHPFVLVHGLASNALLWRAVAEQLNRQRPPGGRRRPERPWAIGAARSGYSTAVGRPRPGRAARRRWGGTTGDPIAAGQSWGGNVVLRAAHDDPRWGGVGRRRRRLDPPAADGSTRSTTAGRRWPRLTSSATTRRRTSWAASTRWSPTGPGGALEAIAGNLELVDGRVRNRLERHHHRSILHSLWADDPADLYAGIDVPVHLIVAGDRCLRGRRRGSGSSCRTPPSAGTRTRTTTSTCSSLTVVTEQLLAVLARVEGSDL